jgi:hypothetical protein
VSLQTVCTHHMCSVRILWINSENIGALCWCSEMSTDPPLKFTYDTNTNNVLLLAWKHELQFRYDKCISNDSHTDHCPKRPSVQERKSNTETDVYRIILSKLQTQRLVYSVHFT